MVPELTQRAMDIAADVLELDPEEREGFLDRSCEGDEALRREVDSLLGYGDVQVGIVDGPIQLLRTDYGAPLEPGQRLGPYRIERLLGSGGMGAVYQAVREDDFEIQVAFKVIKHPVLSDHLADRFRKERQILAKLEHPNIARILDGGTTDDGWPFLVMELVEGEPIDRFCEVLSLPLRQRLELFLDVCAAVQVAHQNLIVHRDLKPGNILVTEGGVPKLIDFGIAKLMASEADLDGEGTVTRGAAMTLEYASPEQVRSEPITVASDVYSLGVVLFELLTGQKFHPPGKSDLEVALSICEDEPPRPSSAVRNRQQPNSTKAFPWWRSTATATTKLHPLRGARDGRSLGEKVEPSREKQKLSLRLAGDLDSIVLKALRQDPSHRYNSVEQFSEDVRRHLDGLPVEAREGTFGYRAAKSLRRNWQWLSASTFVVLVLVSSAFFWVENVRRLDREKASALKADSQSWMRKQLLENLFMPADLDQGVPSTIQGLLVRGEERIRSKLSAEPLATQLETLGLLYCHLEIRDVCLALLEEVLDKRRKIYQGHDHSLVARILNNLAVWFYTSGDYDRAAELYQEALEMRQRLRQEGPDLLPAMVNLAAIRMNRGEYESTELLYLRAEKIAREAYGPKDESVAGCLRSLAIVRYLQSDFDNAEGPVREAFDIRSEVFGAKSTEAASARSVLARVLHAQGKLTEAEEHFLAVLGVRTKELGEEHLHVALTKKDLAAVRLDQGDLASGESLLTEALVVLRVSRPAGAWEIADAESLWGAFLVASKRYEEAEPLLRLGYLRLRETRGEGALYTRRAMRRLDDLFGSWGKPRPAWLDARLTQQKKDPLPRRGEGRERRAWRLTH